MKNFGCKRLTGIGTSWLRLRLELNELLAYVAAKHASLQLGFRYGYLSKRVELVLHGCGLLEQYPTLRECDLSDVWSYALTNAAEIENAIQLNESA